MNSWHRWYTYSVGQSQTTDGHAVTHLRIWKRSGKGGIGWDVLQHIKNEVLGADVWCIEVYPDANNTINEVNMRHLWTLPFPVQVGLHVCCMESR